MTCIVGVKQGSAVTIGGDSAGISGYSLTVRRDPKVFRNGPFLIGYTSSFRMGQLLRFRFQPPPHHPPEKDDFEYIATDFVDAVRQCFKDGGYAKVENSTESGGEFIVGYRGELYVVESDFQVGMAHDPYTAVGCGSEVALGALFASTAKTAEGKIRVALEAAERFSAGVRGPFVIESM